MCADTEEAQGIDLTPFINGSRNSLSRISALGADGGTWSFFLESVGECCSPFLVYKTRVMQYTT